MPLKLLSPGGGSVLLQANTTSLDYTLTVPAETANLITTATTSGINASAMSVGTVPTTRLPTIPKANMPTGSVVQVVQVVKSDTQTLSSPSSWTDVTGMSASITPSSTSNKILVLVKISATSAVNGYHGSFGRLVRDSTPIFVGDAASNRPPMSIYTGVLNDGAGSNHVLTQNISYLDSPSTTSSVTYKIQVQDASSTVPIYINRSQDDSDGAANGRAASSIILMEIVG